MTSSFKISAKINNVLKNTNCPNDPRPYTCIMLLPMKIIKNLGNKFNGEMTLLSVLPYNLCTISKGNDNLSAL